MDAGRRFDASRWYRVKRALVVTMISTHDVGKSSRPRSDSRDRMRRQNERLYSLYVRATVLGGERRRFAVVESTDVVGAMVSTCKVVKVMGRSAGVAFEWDVRVDTYDACHSRRSASMPVCTAFAISASAPWSGLVTCASEREMNERKRAGRCVDGMRWGACVMSPKARCSVRSGAVTC